MIPEATLIKWRSTGEVRIPFVRIGRQIKYRTSDLKAFIEINTIR
ncbi:MAG: helix-turn-helix domain-containing protein [Methylobacter sp.]